MIQRLKVDTFMSFSQEQTNIWDIPSLRQCETHKKHAKNTMIKFNFHKQYNTMKSLHKGP